MLWRFLDKIRVFCCDCHIWSRKAACIIMCPVCDHMQLCSPRKHLEFCKCSAVGATVLKIALCVEKIGEPGDEAIKD